MQLTDTQSAALQEFVLRYLHNPDEAGPYGIAQRTADAWKLAALPPAAVTENLDALFDFSTFTQHFILHLRGLVTYR